MTALRNFLLALRATSLCRGSTTFGELDAVLEPSTPRQTKTEFERRMADRARQYLGLYPSGTGR